MAMAASLPCLCSSLTKTNEKEKDESMKKVEGCYQRYRKLISTLPKEKGWITENMCQYEGFWYHPTYGLDNMMFAQEHFQARPTDVFFISTPKSGTTWLKAIIFAIVKRSCHTNYSTHPLLTTNPHHCVPFLELDVDNIPSPRILSTHVPYPSLPKSILSSSNKIVYITRNPKDTYVLISYWYFTAKLRAKELLPLPLEEAFELFCKGVSGFGPFWDHVLGYWKASLECPRRFFFTTYEEMKRDTLVKVKKLAEFLGQPFSMEEEKKGVVEEILNLCSFDKLRSLEVNKNGTYWPGVKNELFFREGKVGDWKNHLTTEMIERLDQITDEKLHGVF